MTVPNENVYGNFSSNLTFTEVIDNNSNETLTDRVFEQMVITLNIYYTPVLIGLGCVGNILSMIVFFKSKLRLQSTSQYLSALAMSDTVFLCQLLPPWLKAVGASTLFSRDGYCQLFVYLSYVTSNHSAWLVVAFTVERFVAVLYPLRRNSICTVKRARYIIGSLVTAAVLVNIPVLWFAVPNGSDCNIDELLMSHAARFNMVDTVLSFTMPLTMIIVLNIWITCGVCRLGRARRHLQQRSGGVRGAQVSRSSTSQRAQQRVTRMLLVVSSVFVVLNMPAYSMRVIAYAYNLGEGEYTGKWAALQQICLLFFNTNFGINFLLYCLTGQNFRSALRDTFPCWRRRGPEIISLRSLSLEPTVRASSVSISSEHSNSNNLIEATTNHTTNTRTSNIVTERSPSQAGTSHVDEEVTVTRRFTGRMEYESTTLRRGQGKIVIQRWRFDNSRQKKEMEKRRKSLEKQERREFLQMQKLQESYQLTQRQKMHKLRRGSLELQQERDSPESHQRRCASESPLCRDSFNVDQRPLGTLELQVYNNKPHQLEIQDLKEVRVEIHSEPNEWKLQNESNDIQLNNNSNKLQLNITLREQQRMPPGNF